MPAEPTTDRIRKDIQAGVHGDKVAHEDPAMAPLGTDDEAAGTPPTPRERSIAAAPHKPATPKRGPNGQSLILAVVLLPFALVLLILSRVG